MVWNMCWQNISLVTSQKPKVNKEIHLHLNILLKIWLCNLQIHNRNNRIYWYVTPYFSISWKLFLDYIISKFLIFIPIAQKQWMFKRMYCIQDSHSYIYLCMYIYTHIYIFMYISHIYEHNPEEKSFACWYTWSCILSWHRKRLGQSFQISNVNSFWNTSSVWIFKLTYLQWNYACWLPSSSGKGNGNDHWCHNAISPQKSHRLHYCLHKLCHKYQLWLNIKCNALFLIIIRQLFF